MKKKLEQVNYDALDSAKNSFIEASKKTLKFADKFGFIPGSRLGSSANIFSLDLKLFLKSKSSQLYVSILPESLGTASDAKPKNLNAKESQRFWYNIGFKILAAMTNDVASVGAQPILVSLYLPSGSPEIVFNENFRKGFLDGFVEGCRKIGCVYFSGETPQLTSKIFKGKLDVAGAVFGLVVPGNSYIDSNKLAVGDKIVFVQSSGPHENGFTALRKLSTKLKKGYRTKLSDGSQYWEAINAPSVLYTPLVQDILSSGIQPSNIEPITGHGWQKLMRIEKSFEYVIEKTLPPQEIFKFVEKHGHSNPEEMIKIFNYGVGLAIFVKGVESADRIVRIAKNHELNALVAGHVEKSSRRRVVAKPYGVTLNDKEFSLSK